MESWAKHRAFGTRARTFQKVRSVSWNIRHGTDAAGEPRLEAQAALIQAQIPDIVLLQELDRFVDRSGGVDQLAVLAELTNLEHHAFGSNLDLGGGSYGCGILSRWPVLSVKNYSVPQMQLPGELIAGADGRPHLPEPRGVLAVTLLAPQGTVLAVTTHASMHPGERFHGAEMVLRLLGSHDGDWVFGADLNAEEDEVVDTYEPLGIDACAVAGDTLCTFPATNVRIDRIWSRKPALGAILVTDLSDHYMVTADSE